MDKNRLTFGSAANFADCLGAIRVDIETGKFDVFGRTAKPAAKGSSLGGYLAGLADSGRIYPADFEIYSHMLEPEGIRERLSEGRVILNGIRVKPADAYIWTDFELVRPKSCPRHAFIFVRNLRRSDCPDLRGYRLLMRLDPARDAVLPIILPFGGIDDPAGTLERCAESFGAERSALDGGKAVSLRSDGLAFELTPCRGEEPSGLLAAVYETDAVSEERRAEVAERFGMIDAATGLCGGYYVKRRAERSEAPCIGAMLIDAEGEAREKALIILGSDLAENSFAVGERLFVLLTAGSMGRLRHCFGALCRRLADTDGDFTVRIALAERERRAGAEDILNAAEAGIAQTPRDFRWSMAEAMFAVDN